jgi:alpha-tubulin suppressor-like RCC1 family protein
MSVTRPTGEQITFTSSKTGTHSLDTYLEACEAQGGLGRTLPDMLNDLFDLDAVTGTGTGEFRAANFEFQEDPNNAGILQYRIGTFANATSGWTNLSFSSFTGFVADCLTYRQNAQSSASFAGASESDARDWATKMNGTVDNTSEYSAKYYATDSTAGASAYAAAASASAANASGSAVTASGYKDTALTARDASVAQALLSQDWATQTSGTVDGTDYSAKYWATGTAVTTVVNNITDIQTIVIPANLASINSAATDLALGSSSLIAGAFTSAAAALSSQNAASTSETNAATSETNAATSESNALSSKNAAASSETNAAASEAAAISILDNFDDRFLGVKSSDPTLDNDGNALLDGALYYDTVIEVTKVYDQTNTTWLQLNLTATQHTTISNALANMTAINAAPTEAANAAASATAASTSETNAAASESAAASSQSNASSAATVATQGATDSHTYRGHAQTAAQNAATSETNAATSETNALASKNAAATSETNAATSETNAGTSETSALASKTSATSSASSATASQAAALASKTAASTSETNAATSATSALSSKNAAATSETNAATSETNAATSATDAATSLSNLGSHEANAAASATAAATSATSATSSAATALNYKNAAVVSEYNADASATSATASKNSATASATSATASQAASVLAKMNAETAETNAETAETNAETAETNALASKNAAATSETNAATSETNAATSETNAATSETNALASKTAAATSETNALSSKNASAASETAAATSETNALASKTAAATSETNAATSETNAATSATSALASKNASATSETNALASKNAASTSETNALASKNAASASATAASTSKTNAATSETNAATSETNAATSETNAATSETNAATSETNALASKTAAAASASSAGTSATSATASAAAAAASYDDFDDRYLGAKSSDPTTDNDGNALITGALYFNSTAGSMKIWDGTAWVSAFVSLGGALLGANNLSDVSSASTSRTNLGVDAAGTINYTHPNHSGDVVSSADGATTIQAGAVDIAMLSATGTAGATNFLRGDNSWVIPTDTTYLDATTSSAGLMSTTDKSKLDGIAAGASSGGTITATASGALVDGDLLVMKTDGKVEKVEEAVTNTIPNINIGNQPSSVQTSSQTKEMALAWDPYTAGRFVMASVGPDWDNWLQVRAGTVSGGTVTYGTEYNVDDDCDAISIAFDPDQPNMFVITWYEDYQDDVECISGTFTSSTSTSISFGNSVNIQGLGNGPTYKNNMKMAFSGTSVAGGSQFLVAYQDGGTWGDPQLNSCLVSSTGVITSYAANSYTPSATLTGKKWYAPSTMDFACDPNQAGKFLLFYADYDNGSDATVTAISLTSSTGAVTIGTDYIVDTNGSEKMTCSFDPSVTGKFLLSWMTQGIINVQSAILDGPTNNFNSWGTAASLPSTISGTQYIACDPNNSGLFVVFFPDDLSNNSYPTVVVGVWNGGSNNNTIIFRTPYYVIESATNATWTRSAVAFDPTTTGAFGVVYNRGKFALGHLDPAVTSNLTADNFIGISDGAYADGATATIQLTGSIDDAQSGLTIGDRYYAKSDGTLSSVPPIVGEIAGFVGAALSSSEILIGGMTSDLTRGGEAAIGTDSAATYDDGNLFVSASGMAYWKLNDGAEGWYEVGQLLKSDGSYKNSISSGKYHTAIIKTDNTVWATGNNAYGALGDGTNTNRNTFVSSGISAIAVSCGLRHTMAIKADGTVWGAGQNNVGQLGNGSGNSSNTFVSSGVSAIAVSCSWGTDSTIIIKPDNTVWGTGRNGNGQLGDGTTTNRATWVSCGISAIAVSGNYHTMVIKADGTVWGTGLNTNGQLGDGTTTARTTFVSSGVSAIAVSAGYDHTAIIKPDNTVWSVGSNAYGQLGDGTTTNRSAWVSSGISAIAVNCGHLHTMVIKADNTLWSTGHNGWGQLGDGTTTNRSAFVNTGISVLAVSCAYYQTLIIKSDDTVWGVGYNSNGQLGDGTYSNSYSTWLNSGISGTYLLEGVRNTDPSSFT